MLTLTITALTFLTFLVSPPSARPTTRCGAPLAAELWLSDAGGADTPDASLLRRIWEQRPKPMLRLGKSGVGETHANSLRSLVREHAIVVIKFNGPQDRVDELAEALCARGATEAEAEEGSAPVFLASRRLRRGGSEGLFAQRSRAAEVGGRAYYDGIEAAETARLEKDAEYAAKREAKV
jgi:hypothetical protein